MRGKGHSVNVTLDNGDVVGDIMDEKGDDEDDVEVIGEDEYHEDDR